MWGVLWAPSSTLAFSDSGEGQNVSWKEKPPPVDSRLCVCHSAGVLRTGLPFCGLFSKILCSDRILVKTQIWLCSSLVKSFQWLPIPRAPCTAMKTLPGLAVSLLHVLPSLHQEHPESSHFIAVQPVLETEWKRTPRKYIKFSSDLHGAWQDLIFPCVCCLSFPLFRKLPESMVFNLPPVVSSVWNNA